MFKAAVLAAALAFATAAHATPTYLEAPGHLAGDLDRIKLSPSGDKIAAFLDTPDGPRLLVITRDGQILSNAAPGETHLRRLVWAGDDHLLYEIAALLDPTEMFWKSGREYSQLFFLNVRTNKVMPAMDRKLSIHPIISGDYGVFPFRGGWKVAVGGVTKMGAGEMEKDFNLKTFSVTHPWPDLYTIDVDTGWEHKEAGGAPALWSWVVDRNGVAVARVQRSLDAGDLSLHAIHRDKTDTYGAHSADDVLWTGSGAVETVFDAGVSNGAEAVFVSPKGAALEAKPASPGGALFGGRPVRRLLRGPDDRLIGAEVAREDGGLEDRFLDAAVQAAFDKAKAASGAPNARFVAVDGARRFWILKASDGYRLVDVTSKSAARLSLGS